MPTDSVGWLELELALFSAACRLVQEDEQEEVYVRLPVQRWGYQARDEHVSLHENHSSQTLEDKTVKRARCQVI